ncbi:group II intron reverse transcriptase/maturase [Mycobacterium sp.]|uniref:group II intron reverse transcriptase/maturase n=1 Tax=Mycobacterium sp. TaxID=1785 RepID=UPI002BFAD984|nr:group II intron reverse transcriptase/maturase [Mycobacterium sp.]HTY33754.1 group II intron reverse transcriptase/maturase [Mycobacterium sp.]
MNIGAALELPFSARQKVLRMQTKLHCWAATDRGRRFDDLFNLVADPCFLAVAWTRVRENTGARSAGIDKRTARSIENSPAGVAGFLEEIREALRSRSFRPEPVRRVEIPKASGKVRKLGIPTVADRVVQAALKLVLEPIFETDFSDSSYGFRPGRRAPDAIEDIRFHAHRGYEWVFEADIAACFDEIDHTALMGRVRGRIGDKRVLALVKAFLLAGVLETDGLTYGTSTGTPQGGILSPLLANIALSVIDDHFDTVWAAHHDGSGRRSHRQRGGATYRLVRYADDFVILVFGARGHADALWEQVSNLLIPMGLRLAPEKTQVVHLDEGFDFLGFRIQRHTQKGSTRRYVYSYPSRKSVQTIRRKLKTLTKQITHRPPDQLFRQLNSMVRGWAQYFRHSAASHAYATLGNYLWWRVWAWLLHKHPHTGKRALWARHHVDRWPEYNGVRLYHPAAMRIQRYRYRGAQIPTPWETINAVPA